MIQHYVRTVLFILQVLFITSLIITQNMEINHSKCYFNVG